MEEQNEICPESFWEHPVGSNDARTVWSNQFLNSQCERETNLTSTSSVVIEDILAKGVLEHESVILVAQTSQGNTLYECIIFLFFEVGF